MEIELLALSAIIGGVFGALVSHFLGNIVLSGQIAALKGQVERLYDSQNGTKGRAKQDDMAEEEQAMIAAVFERVRKGDDFVTVLKEVGGTNPVVAMRAGKRLSKALGVDLKL